MNIDIDPRAPGNQMRAGITPDMMEDAVSRSGYPLQTEVALVLMKHAKVREEWSYPDRETGKLRAVDIMALKMLDEGATGAIPRLSLLVECKRSDLPYVFFRTATDTPPPDFPAVYGLSARLVSIASPQGSTETFACNILGLPEHPFVKDGPAIAATFSRAERKGGKGVVDLDAQKLELSGTDPFGSIVMPLVAASAHAESYFDRWKPAGCAPTLTMGVCVLDAPMILADARTRPHALTLAPWVRVVRQEVAEEPRHGMFRFYSVDIVHFSFLDRWMTEHLLPFAETFKDRVEEKKDALRTGARVKDMQKWHWSEVEAQEPRPPARP